MWPRSSTSKFGANARLISPMKIKAGMTALRFLSDFNNSKRAVKCRNRDFKVVFKVDESCFKGCFKG